LVSVAIHGVTARSNPAFSRIEEKNAFFDINKAYLEPAKSVISLIAITRKNIKHYVNVLPLSSAIRKWTIVLFPVGFRGRN